MVGQARRRLLGGLGQVSDAVGDAVGSMVGGVMSSAMKGAAKGAVKGVFGGGVGKAVGQAVSAVTRRKPPTQAEPARKAGRTPAARSVSKPAATR